MPAKFVLSKGKLREQADKLKELGLKTSYSYKTNRIVGSVLQELDRSIEFSIHSKDEIEDITDKTKIWFFSQAESLDELKELLRRGIRNFVVDNETDLRVLIEAVKESGVKISLSLRMKFMEHRIGTGKYFVYGMPAKKINELIQELGNNKSINRLGVHIHRKSQNTSEWEIRQEIEDSLTRESLETISFINLGGGLPSVYRSSSVEVFGYIFGKVRECAEWLKQKNIEVYIEPGRFLAAPCIKLETEVIQKYDNNLVLNTTIYNCALDNLFTGTKMLVEGERGDEEEQESGEEWGYYLIKGNSPTRDDIFRYRARLKNVEVGDKIVFLNAGAYNYTSDFFGYVKLETDIREEF